MTAANKIPERSELDPSHTWNLEALYGALDAWEHDLAALDSLVEPLEAFRGKLDSAEQLAAFYAAETTFDRALEKLWVYASNRANEDTGDSDRQSRKDRLMAAYVKASGRLAWVEPELLQQEEDTLRAWAAADSLAENRYAVEKLIRRKPHTLSVDRRRRGRGHRRPLRQLSREFGPARARGRLRRHVGGLRFGAQHRRLHARRQRQSRQLQRRHPRLRFRPVRVPAPRQHLPGPVQRLDRRGARKPALLLQVHGPAPPPARPRETRHVRHVRAHRARHGSHLRVGPGPHLGGRQLRPARRGPWATCSPPPTNSAIRCTAISPTPRSRRASPATRSSSPRSPARSTRPCCCATCSAKPTT